ncbi:MAG: DUF2752 domain-containing protein [Chryseobacterium sp.]|nr:MAG: DUF2752 domain-containing protein [Chryseobacterium sp.]
MKIEDFMLPCPSKKFLGIECFGCGTQRALVLVFEGKFAEAFHMFPAVYTLILFLGFVVLNFIDKKRNYGQVLIFLAIVNSLIMVFSYFYKHFIIT